MTSSDHRINALAKVARKEYEQGRRDPAVQRFLGANSWDYDSSPSKNRVFGFCPSAETTIKKANESVAVAMDALKNKQPSNSAIEELKPLFSIEDETSIQKFMTKYKFLFNLILEAVPQIKRAFGPEAQCALRMSSDHEEDGASLLLAIKLPENKYQEANQALKKFDSDWWDEQYARSECKLNIDLRFRPTL